MSVNGMFLDIEKKNASQIAAIDDQGMQITYGELTEVAEEFRNVLLPRSIVFFLSRNSIGAVAAYIAMLENDVIPVMLSADMDAELLQNLLATYQPQYLCVPSADAARFSFAPVCEKRGYVYLATNFEAYSVHEELQLLMTTSGSTGSPKLVRYKKGNLEANARNVAAAWGWTESERPICDLKMNYTMGLNVINTHLFVGATLLLVSKNITDAGYWSFIKKEKATNFTGVPFSYDILWKLRFTRMELPYLTTLSEGGGKLTDDMFSEVAEFAAKKGKRFIASFGTTETSARLSMLDPDKALEKNGSIGKPIPEGEMLLIDENGDVITESPAEGELVYKGPNVTMGYAVSMEDLRLGDEFKGVYRTGDVAYRDQDGFYFIVGRKSRFLKMLGHRVSLDQCERMLQEKFHIECACGGDDTQMKVFVTNDEYADEIKRFLSEKTRIYTSMFAVVKVDAIPRNATGKIIYKELE